MSELVSMIIGLHAWISIWALTLKGWRSESLSKPWSFRPNLVHLHPLRSKTKYYSVLLYTILCSKPNGLSGMFEPEMECGWDWRVPKARLAAQTILLLDTYYSSTIPGLTGFDRMCEGVCQHAGSWDESLKRWSWQSKWREYLRHGCLIWPKVR